MHLLPFTLSVQSCDLRGHTQVVGKWFVKCWQDCPHQCAMSRAWPSLGLQVSKLVSGWVQAGWLTTPCFLVAGCVEGLGPCNTLFPSLTSPTLTKSPGESANGRIGSLDGICFLRSHRPFCRSQPHSLLELPLEEPSS